MTVKITPNDKGTPPGKLAEAEVHFEDGYFQGLKLVGFAVWERRNGNGRNVTFPARSTRSTASGEALRCCARLPIRRRRIACAISSCRRTASTKSSWRSRNSH